MKGQDRVPVPDTTIIGLDCAVQARKTGLAVGRIEGERVVVEAAAPGRDAETLVASIAKNCARAERTLLAIDAPLGWPMALGAGLVGHGAGAPLEGLAAQLFTRATDRAIHARLGKKPLDVGADRIARTALRALQILEEVRGATGREVELAWEASFEGIGVVEVYPAGTLTALGLDSRGYKKREQAGRRAELVEALANEVDLTAVADQAVESDDLLDAALCVLAGADFLRGLARGPEDLDLARREGWIWAR